MFSYLWGYFVVKAFQFLNLNHTFSTFSTKLTNPAPKNHVVSEVCVWLFFLSVGERSPFEELRMRDSI